MISVALENCGFFVDLTFSGLGFFCEEFCNKETLEKLHTESCVSHSVPLKLTYSAGKRFRAHEFHFAVAVFSKAVEAYGASHCGTSEVPLQGYDRAYPSFPCNTFLHRFRGQRCRCFSPSHFFGRRSGTLSPWISKVLQKFSRSSKPLFQLLVTTVQLGKTSFDDLWGYECTTVSHQPLAFFRGTQFDFRTSFSASHQCIKRRVRLSSTEDIGDDVSGDEMCKLLLSLMGSCS